VCLPHFRHLPPLSAALVPGTVLAGVVDDPTTVIGPDGLYGSATRAAEAMRGLPQSRQYCAFGSFSWPQNVQNVLTGTGVGIGKRGGEGGAATITYQSPAG